MMRQYLEIKEQHSDCILFFRLGDFYETFFEDAELVSRELELTLTGKDCGLEKRALCGEKHHAADVYVKRLIEKGYKVAICEQMSDPALSKGLVGLASYARYHARRSSILPCWKTRIQLYSRYIFKARRMRVLR